MHTPEEETDRGPYWPGWEEDVRRMTQMSQDIDDGLYDDVFDPVDESSLRIITDQMPYGYAYDYDEDRFGRFDPDLPDAFILKTEAGYDWTIPAPDIIRPEEAEADPDRYQTRTEPAPETQYEYWREHVRRVKQIWEDYENGRYDDVDHLLERESVLLIINQLPDGYAYDRREHRIVRLDPSLRDVIAIRENEVTHHIWQTPTVIRPEEAAADPDRYQTRTWMQGG